MTSVPSDPPALSVLDRPNSYIGKTVPRPNLERLMQGRGLYVSDLELPRMAHVVFLRSPHAHATIRSIDTAAAKAMPGVLAVLTGEDLAADKVGGLICGWMIHSKDGAAMKMGAWPAMAPETVRFVGQAVAVVIAETRNQARDAAEAVVVDYEELPVAADIKAAIAPGAPPMTAPAIWPMPARMEYFCAFVACAVPWRSATWLSSWAMTPAISPSLRAASIISPHVW